MIRIARNSGVLLTLLAASSPTSADRDSGTWPRFRGPNGSGVVADNRALPSEFGPGKDELWRTATPPGHSSPCVWHTHIFLTGYDAAAKNLETWCLNRGDGRVLWRRFLPVKQLERMHRVNSPAASTPTTDGQRIYAYFGSFGLVCYDLDGTECWRLPCPAPATSFGSAASPIVVGEFVIVLLQGRNAHVLAVERKTGKPAWTNDRLVYRPSYSTPVVWKRDDAEELIVHGIGGVSACNPRDGQVRWWISGLPIEAIPSPIISEGRLFVAGSIPGGDPDHRIPLPTFDELLKQLDGNKDGFLAHEEVPRDWVLYRREGSDGVGDITLRSVFGMIDANKDKRVGRLEWGLAKALVATANDTLASIGPGAMHDATRTHIAWRESRGLPEVPSPLCYRGRIYLVKNGGVVSCLDALTGKLHFRSRLGAGGTYYASPVAGDGKVYFASESGVITVIEAADSLKVLTRNDFGEAIYATPALVQGAIYVRTAKQVYAFGKKL